MVFIHELDLEKDSLCCTMNIGLCKVGLNR